MKWLIAFSALIIVLIIIIFLIFRKEPFETEATQNNASPLPIDKQLRAIRNDLLVLRADIGDEKCGQFVDGLKKLNKKLTEYVEENGRPIDYKALQEAHIMDQSATRNAQTAARYSNVLEDHNNLQHLTKTILLMDSVIDLTRYGCHFPPDIMLEINSLVESIHAKFPSTEWKDPPFYPDREHCRYWGLPTNFEPSPVWAGPNDYCEWTTKQIDLGKPHDNTSNVRRMLARNMMIKYGPPATGRVAKSNAMGEAIKETANMAYTPLMRDALNVPRARLTTVEATVPTGQYPKKFGINTVRSLIWPNKKFTTKRRFEILNPPKEKVDNGRRSL
jgi:hypothetical protein